jgi:uncharacterized protein DUF222/HNH endonuclease
VLSDQATNSDLADLPMATLEDELATLASHLSAGMCRWLELVAELDRRAESADEGATAKWLAWRCALDPRTAREHVRVARRLAELPLTRAAFARGRLSYTKVRALTRVAEERFEGELLELAFAMTAAQLERALGAYRRVTTKEAVWQQEDAYLSWYWDEDGSLVLSGRLAPEEGALVLRALEAGKDQLRGQGRKGEGGSAEPRPKNADALVAMAESQLATPAGHAGGERYQVVVHVEAEALAAAESAGCRLEDGPALAAETLRRIACDASLVTSLERDGEPLNVGRKRRTVPTGLRRALERRDRRCRYPGCENRLGLDAHHLQHWAQGGETKLENLVLLCRRHHRLLHEGGYRAEVRADGSIAFEGRWGVPIPDVPRPPPGSLERLLEGHQHLEIDGDTCQCGDNDPMDLNYAVDALFAIAGQRQ